MLYSWIAAAFEALQRQHNSSHDFDCDIKIFSDIVFTQLETLKRDWHAFMPFHP